MADETGDKQSSERLLPQWEKSLGLYQALLPIYSYEDELIWSRTQLIFAIQAAVLAGGFSQRTSFLGWVIMIMGAGLTFLIFLLVLRSLDCRNNIGDTINKFSENILTTDEIKKLTEDGKKLSLKTTDFSPPPPKWRCWAIAFAF